MQVRLKHDQGEGEHEGTVRVRKLPRVVIAVLLRELLHHSVDLLRLAGQAEDRQEEAQAGVQLLVAEVLHVGQRVEDRFVERLVLAEVVADRSLVQAYFLIQEKLRYSLWVVTHKPVLLQVLDASLRLHVEFVHADLHLQFPLLVLHYCGRHLAHRAPAAAASGQRLARRVILCVAVRLGPAVKAAITILAVLEATSPLILGHPARPVHDGPHESHECLQGKKLQLLLLVRLDEVCVLHRGVLPLRDLRQTVDHALEDVLLVNVTIEVQKELQGRNGISAELVKDLQHSVLVGVCGVSALQDPQEDLLNEDANLSPEMLFEICYQHHEDLQGEAEDLGDWRHTVLDQ
mmetsp:Transcript_33175/g.91724  ORF Transcript_33175/g.91724 Transcript_33175/m.91724 type:complete len:347 (-) Transcript_33175:607-1647(-)